MKSRSAAAAVAAKRSELDRIGRQMTRLVNAMADGADALILNSKLKETEAKQASLTAELDSISRAEPVFHPNLARIYRQKV
jgi:site-specific DNA recombinase